MTGSWIPNIDDVVMVKSSGGLLNIAMKRLNRKVISTYRDNIGMVSFETEEHVVVAKKYIYGYLVSAHEDVITYAKENNKKLLMFISDINTFYEFNPEQVIGDSKPNKRGSAMMLNFDIKKGTRFKV